VSAGRGGFVSETDCRARALVARGALSASQQNGRKSAKIQRVRIAGRQLAWLIALAGIGAGAPAALASTQLTTSKPSITATPSSVMVNGKTKLVGRHFAPNTVLALRECGRTFWLAPAYPCNTANAVSVKTNARGAFALAFKVELCPEGAKGEHPTERICYIGALETGEDTGTLVGAARISVTYP
jgi:hypothetical protein